MGAGGWSAGEGDRGQGGNTEEGMVALAKRKRFGDKAWKGGRKDGEIGRGLENSRNGERGGGGGREVRRRKMARP